MNCVSPKKALEVMRAEKKGKTVLPLFNFFLPAIVCIHSMPLAGPKIALHIRFPRLFVFLYVHILITCAILCHTHYLVYAKSALLLVSLIIRMRQPVIVLQLHLAWPGLLLS